jgi:hypothetical protein
LQMLFPMLEAFFSQESTSLLSPVLLSGLSLLKSPY